MKNKIIGISTALVIGCSTSVMAQDDLAGFFDRASGMATQMGGAVSFTERNIGTDNSVEYIDLSVSSPDGEIVILADWLKAVPSATTLGQVTFTLSPSASVTINDSSFLQPLVLNIANNGLTVMVDGLTSGQDAETLNYSVRANNLSVTADASDNPFLRALDLTITDLVEDFSINMATMLITSSGGIADATYHYDFTSPEQDEMKGKGTFESFEYALSFFVIDEDRIGEYMSGALNAMFELSIGDSTGSSAIKNSDMDLAYSGVSDASTLSASMQDGRFTFRQTAGSTEYSFTKFNISGMPIPPFDLSADGAEIEISLPFETKGEFEEAKVFMSLQNIAVSESLYSMIDPGQVISREPINMVIDVTANVKSTVDWADPETAFDSGIPADIGEIQDVSINQLMISAAGAKLLAEGSALIDNSMGFPFPTGNVVVTITGIQALANGLVELGLIPGEQVGMAMGMMMAFARPGSMADEFVSDIEFSPRGVTANGVPLPF